MCRWRRLLTFDDWSIGGALAVAVVVCSMLEKVRHERLSRRWRGFAFAITILGAALLFGDGIITPAISVLSALEGLSSHSPEASRFIMPLSVVVLLILFAIQRFGTGKVGLLFGPIMLVWFFSIGILGAMAIIEQPEVLRAINPMYGFEFGQRHAKTAFVVLGALSTFSIFPLKGKIA